MREVEKYIRDRIWRDADFVKDFEVGYEQFKIGAFLRSMREQAHLTQEDLARKMNTRKSAISRIENHAENINVVTLQRYAAALGKRIQITVK